MWRAPKHVAPIAIIACSALLAGCSSDSSDSNDGNEGGGGNGSASVPNPCTLLSNAELEPITGIEIARSERQSDRDGAEICVWYSAEDDSLVTTEIYPSSSIFDATQSTRNPPAISGLGAAAYLGPNGDIWVKMPSGMSFFAASLVPAADGTISAEIKSAASAESMTRQLEYEASYRMATLEADKL